MSEEKGDKMEENIIGVEFNDDGPAVPEDLWPALVEVSHCSSANGREFKVAKVRTGGSIFWLYPQGDDFARKMCEVLNSI